MVRLTIDRHLVFGGAELFRLKDECGFPLAMAFIQCARDNIEIDWIGLIEAARAHGWWDYQTLDMIAEAFSDSGVWGDRRKTIEGKLKTYVVLKRHPAMA